MSNFKDKPFVNNPSKVSYGNSGFMFDGGTNNQDKNISITGYIGAISGIHALLETISGSMGTLSGNLVSGYQEADLSLSGSLVSSFQDADTEIYNSTTSGYIVADEAVTSGFQAGDDAVTSGYISADAVIASGAQACCDAVTSGYLAGDEAVISGYQESDASLSGALQNFINENVVLLTGNQTISGDKTFTNTLVVNGDFYVAGTRTELNTESILVEDNIITVNSTVTGNPDYYTPMGGGISVKRGDEPDSELYWNELTNKWEIGISGALETVVTQSMLDTVESGAQNCCDSVTSGYIAADTLLSGNILNIVGAQLSGTSLVGTDDYYVDGTLGDDAAASGNPAKPFKTIQGCLNFLGQPVTKADYMRHITIHVSDALTAQPGISPGNSWNGVYRENLVVPNRSITIIGKGIKIGNNLYGETGYGDILKEYSSSRRFGCSSSDFRPCLTLMGLMNVRDSHNRLRNGIHVGGNCRTTILKRNFDSIQGNGSNQITVHIAAGQNTYPITIPSTYPTDPYIRIAVTGTTNYNGTYDITSKLNDTTFVATRVSGTNAHTEVEVSGSFFESDSAGASGLSHDVAFVNCYMQGSYTCDDGTVNGAAVTAGTEVMYAIGSRFYTGIEGRTILMQRWENNTLAGTNIVNSIAGMMNCSLAGALTVSTFTYSTDDMGLMNCRFNSAVAITVGSAGQTARMDNTTFTSFLRTGCTWVTNTPTIELLDGPTFGTTVNRPTVRPTGYNYFDTTINRPVWYTGSTWLDLVESGVTTTQSSFSGFHLLWTNAGGNKSIVETGGISTDGSSYIQLTSGSSPSSNYQLATKLYVDNKVASGGGGGGGTSLSLTDFSQNLTFSGETYKTFDLSVSGNSPDIVYGNLYFDSALSGNFSDTVRVEFYSTTNRIDNELIYVSEIPISYSTLSGTATSGNSSISLYSSTGMAANNLIYIQSPNPEFRRITSVVVNNVLNLKNNLVNSHSIGAGVSKVGEIGSIMLFDGSSGKKIYGKVLFSTAQTCSLTFSMKVRS